MKPIFVFLVCVLLAISVFAKNSEHLEFEGIPVSGKTVDIIKKLELNDFVKCGEKEFICNDAGIFKNSVVQLVEIGDKGETQGLLVFLPSHDEWGGLLINYNEIKSHLMQEYGAPVKDESEFSSISLPKTDEEKIEALKNGACSFSSIFQCDSGVVLLSLGYSEKFRCHVQLLYLDSSGMIEYLSIGESHLNFMGIPINGSIESFANELKNKNMIYLATINGYAAFRGNFAGYHNCSVYVNYVGDQDIVCSVGVTFPYGNNWNSVYSNYVALKNMLIKKYGEPTTVIEEFQGGKQPDNDYMKWNYAKSNRCNYETNFELKEGTISVSIKSVEIDYEKYCYVQLLYIDGINSLKKSANVIDDL